MLTQGNCFRPQMISMRMKMIMAWDIFATWKIVLHVSQYLICLPIIWLYFDRCLRIATCQLFARKSSRWQVYDDTCPKLGQHVWGICLPFANIWIFECLGIFDDIYRSLLYVGCYACPLRSVLVTFEKRLYKKAPTKTDELPEISNFRHWGLYSIKIKYEKTQTFSLKIEMFFAKTREVKPRWSNAVWKISEIHPVFVGRDFPKFLYKVSC